MFRGGRWLVLLILCGWHRKKSCLPHRGRWPSVARSEGVSLRTRGHSPSRLTPTAPSERGPRFTAPLGRWDVEDAVLQFFDHHHAGPHEFHSTVDKQNIGQFGSGHYPAAKNKTPRQLPCRTTRVSLDCRQAECRTVCHRRLAANKGRPEGRPSCLGDIRGSEWERRESWRKPSPR